MCNKELVTTSHGQHTSGHMGKLLNIYELSEQKGRPVRQLRNFVTKRLIPYYKVGHRSVLFDPQEVDKALQRFKIEAVTAKNAK
jgi:hypothetical protein